MSKNSEQDRNTHSKATKRFDGLSLAILLVVVLSLLGLSFVFLHRAEFQLAAGAEELERAYQSFVADETRFGPLARQALSWKLTYYFGFGFVCIVLGLYFFALACSNARRLVLMRIELFGVRGKRLDLFRGLLADDMPMDLGKQKEVVKESGAGWSRLDPAVLLSDLKGPVSKYSGSLVLYALLVLLALLFLLLRFSSLFGLPLLG